MLYGTVWYVGVNGVAWSQDVPMEKVEAYYLYFNSSSVESSNHDGRYRAFRVR